MESFKYKVVFDTGDSIKTESFSELSEICKRMNESKYIFFLNCIVKSDSVLYLVDYDEDDEECLF